MKFRAGTGFHSPYHVVLLEIIVETRNCMRFQMTGNQWIPHDIMVFNMRSVDFMNKNVILGRIWIFMRKTDLRSRSQDFT